MEDKKATVWERLCDNTAARVMFSVLAWGLFVWAIIHYAFDAPESTLGTIVVLILGVLFIAVDWGWNFIKDIGFGGVFIFVLFMWLTSSYLGLINTVHRLEGKVDMLLSTRRGEGVV